MAQSVADRACNLECVKGPIHEFVGPVKIVFVEPPKGAYTRTAWGSAFVALANMFMAFVVVSVLLSTLLFKLRFPMNYHIFVCTVGYQLCIPSGILMLSQLNGAAANLNYNDKVNQHMILNIFGTGCALAGTFCAVVIGKDLKIETILATDFTIHAITGLGAGMLACTCILSGLCLYLLKKDWMIKGPIRFFHTVCGVTSFFLSSVCFVLGLLRPFFETAFNIMELRTILLIFTIYYSIVILIESLIHMFKSRE